MALHPLSSPFQWTFRRVIWATLVLLSVVLGFWLLYQFYQVVSSRTEAAALAVRNKLVN